MTDNFVTFVTFIVPLVKIAANCKSSGLLMKERLLQQILQYFNVREKEALPQKYFSFLLYTKP